MKARPYQVAARVSSRKRRKSPPRHSDPAHSRCCQQGSHAATLSPCPYCVLYAITTRIQQHKETPVTPGLHFQPRPHYGMSHQRQDRDDTAIPPLTSAHSFAEKGCATVGRQAQSPANEGGTTGPGGPSLVYFTSGTATSSRTCTRRRFHSHHLSGPHLPE